MAEEATRNRGGYSNYQDTFVWRKLLFYGRTVKLGGASAPLAPPFPPPMLLLTPAQPILLIPVQPVKKTEISGVTAVVY